MVQEMKAADTVVAVVEADISSSRGGGHGRSRGGSRGGVKRKRGDENEFEQDMKKAALTLPFFGNVTYANQR